MTSPERPPRKWSSPRGRHDAGSELDRLEHVVDRDRAQVVAAEDVAARRALGLDQVIAPFDLDRRHLDVLAGTEADVHPGRHSFAHLHPAALVRAIADRLGAQGVGAGGSGEPKAAVHVGHDADRRALEHDAGRGHRETGFGRENSALDLPHRLRGHSPPAPPAAAERSAVTRTCIMVRVLPRTNRSRECRDCRPRRPSTSRPGT